MVDDFYERYRKVPQKELFEMLTAGSPNGVSSVAGAWRTAGDSVAALAAGLAADLATLAPAHDSVGGRELQYRVGLVVAYARKLADEAAAIRAGLTVMGEALADAQRRAAPDRPEPTDDATASTGLALGFTQAADEQAKARERVAVLVARLAAEYAVTGNRSWPVEVPQPPVGLPESVIPTPVGDVVAPASAAPAPDGPVPTELAGAGGFGGALPVGPVSVSAAPPAAPVTLGGGGPGLMAAGLAATGVRAEGRTSTPGSPVAGAGAMPMMAGGMVAGAGGRIDSGYATTDPRFDGGGAWATDDNVSFDTTEDAPPAILGDRTV